MKTEISVIVPVYNVKFYLRKCLDSIIDQSMKGIEILLIDDGSTDGSEDICDEYAIKDSRIKVIHQNNGGISCARNVGLNMAQGEYVMFVDSDDYVEKDFCRLPFETAIFNKSDLVLFRYNHIINDNLYVHPKNYYNFLISEGDKSKQEAFDIMLNVSSVGVWNKLYKKELFDSIRFPEGKVFEDAGTSYKLVLASNSIFYINKTLYNYRIRNDSVSKILNSKSKIDLITMYYEMQQALLKEKLNFRGDTVATLLALKYLLFYGPNSDLSYKCNQIIIDYLSKTKERNNISRPKWFLLHVSQKSPFFFGLSHIIFKLLNYSKPF